MNLTRAALIATDVWPPPRSRPCPGGDVGPFASNLPCPLLIAAKRAYIGDVPSGTMAINAHVINGSDPGAVPGGSTKIPFGIHGAETGSTDV